MGWDGMEPEIQWCESADAAVITAHSTSTACGRSQSPLDTCISLGR